MFFLCNLSTSPFCLSLARETKCRTPRTLRFFAVGLVAWLGFALAFPATAPAQETATEQTTVEAPPEAAADVLTPEEIPAEVKQVAERLFKQVAGAERLRATVRMEVVSAIGDEVLGKNQGLFQIASQIPNLFSLTAKFDPDAVRVISTGDELYIQLSPTEYVQSDAPASLNTFVAAMPLQLGPQPESMLWLSVAGMRPEELLLSGLSDISMGDGEMVEGKTTKIITAERPERAKWELTLSTGEQPRPLSLAIDITQMITKSNNLQVPEDYSFRVRYEFDRWEIDPELDAELFKFSPPENGQKFDSLAEYLESKSSPEQHPLLGQPVPTFTAPSLDGETVELKAKPGEVVVLDFWATWCGPCVEALPEMLKLMEEFEGRGVRFHAISVSEEREAVAEFIEAKELGKLPVILDAEGQLATAFAASAIPQTVLVGKDGRVEAVHIGFDPEQSIELLRSEIETLLADRRLFQAEAVEEAPEQEESSADSDQSNQQ